MLTNWAAHKSDWSLPLDKPAREFQYRHYINWETYAYAFGMTLRQGTGSWKMQLVLQDNTVIFEQEVSLIINMVALNYGGIELFTWWSNSELIRTTIIGGQPVGPAPYFGNWQYVWSPEVLYAPNDIVRFDNPETEERRTYFALVGGINLQPDLNPDHWLPVPSDDHGVITWPDPAWSHTIGNTVYSEFGTMEKGGGTDVTLLRVFITDWWDSPVYVMPVYPGTKLNVISDHWGLGVQTRPEWQFRFQYGQFQLVDCKFGPFGELNVVHGSKNNPRMRIGHSWGDNRSLQDYAYIEGAVSPSLAFTAEGHRIIGLLFTNGFWEYISRDFGRSIEPLEYASEAAGIKTTEPIFGPETMMPQLVSVGNIRMALGTVGQEIHVRRILRDGPAELVTVGSFLGQNSYAIDVDPTGRTVIVDSYGIPVYETLDQGLSWQEIQPL